jgi:hypothetical protein
MRSTSTLAAAALAALALGSAPFQAGAQANLPVAKALVRGVAEVTHAESGEPFAQNGGTALLFAGSRIETGDQPETLVSMRGDRLALGVESVVAFGAAGETSLEHGAALFSIDPGSPTRLLAAGYELVVPPARKGAESAAGILAIQPDGWLVAKSYEKGFLLRDLTMPNDDPDAALVAIPAAAVVKLPPAEGTGRKIILTQQPEDGELQELNEEEFIAQQEEEDDDDEAFILFGGDGSETAFFGLSGTTAAVVGTGTVAVVGGGTVAVVEAGNDDENPPDIDPPRVTVSPSAPPPPPNDPPPDHGNPK